MAQPEKPSGSLKNMNQVELNAQWEESVKKESRGRVLNEKFDFNPKNLRVISNKPTEKTKSKEEFKAGEGESDDQLKKKLEVLGSIPKKKYPFPMTSAQEVGWDADVLFDAHKPKYAFNRQTQNECSYADTYIKYFHQNPHTITNKVQTVADPAQKK